MSESTTRLERITCALLQSDYVKIAFLNSKELTGMARLIEINLQHASTIRLERITCALLRSDYVKMRYLKPEELVEMARLIEIDLERVSTMTESQAREFIHENALK